MTAKIDPYLIERNAPMKLRDKLAARMVELAADTESPWTALGSMVGATLRFTETVPTPDYHRGEGFGRWDQDTYDRHVFLTLVAGKFILGVATAPWMGRSDSDIPLWLAEAILEDPALGFDDARRWQLKAARRAGIRGDGVRGYS
jgi:hypothetical protein